MCEVGNSSKDTLQDTTTTISSFFKDHFLHDKCGNVLFKFFFVVYQVFHYVSLLNIGLLAFVRNYHWLFNFTLDLPFTFLLRMDIYDHLLLFCQDLLCIQFLIFFCSFTFHKQAPRSHAMSRRNKGLNLDLYLVIQPGSHFFCSEFPFLVQPQLSGVLHALIIFIVQI